MNVTALEPLGARIEAVSITALEPAEVQELTRVLAERGVVIFPDQRVGDAQFVHFLRSFGPLTFTTGETPVAGHEDLNVVSNVGRETPPRSSFHVDTSYVRSPPAYTALRAVTVPDHGGETVFSDQRAAYAELSDELKDELGGRSLRHVVTGVELGPDDEAEAEHLLFRPHPITGDVSLYLTTPSRCREISGLSAARSQELVERLYAHSTREHNLLRHPWSAGDVVMWDNSTVLHRADHSAVDGDRVLHRGMVAHVSPGLSPG